MGRGGRHRANGKRRFSFSEIGRKMGKTILKTLVELLVRNKIDKNAKTTGTKLGLGEKLGPRIPSFLLERFGEKEIKDIILILDSNALFFFK